jgi:hypothetical protein
MNWRKSERKWGQTETEWGDSGLTILNHGVQGDPGELKCPSPSRTSVDRSRQTHSERGGKQLEGGCLRARSVAARPARIHPRRKRLQNLILETLRSSCAQQKRNMGTILLIVLVLLLIGALPTWPHSRNWGYGPTGGLGLVLVILLILVLMGKV